jgi:hypothetical protein
LNRYLKIHFTVRRKTCCFSIHTSTPPVVFKKVIFVFYENTAKSHNNCWRENTFSLLSIMWCIYIYSNNLALNLENVIPLYLFIQPFLQLSDQYNTINALTFIYSSYTRYVSAIIRRYYNNIKGKLRKRPLLYITIQP